MVNPSFSCNVLAGKKAFDAITFMDSDLTDNGITAISDIELTFMVLDNVNFSTILESDKVTITF